MKANPNPAILALLKSEGAWIDAVSPGEVRAALEAGFTPRKILFIGTSLSTSDLRSAFGQTGLTVNIDALEQIELMADVKTRSFRNKAVRVSVRWNPGMGRGFSPRAITAGERSSDGTPIKFGVEKNKVLATYKKAAESGFSPVGLHQHLGSGWVKEDLETVKAAVDKMVEMASKLEREGFRLEFLDFGGGFGPKYHKNQRLFPVQEYIRYFCEKIRQGGLGIRPERSDHRKVSNKNGERKFLNALPGRLCSLGLLERSRKGLSTDWSPSGIRQPISQPAPERVWAPTT